MSRTVPNQQIPEIDIPRELREMGEAWARFYANRTQENLQAAIKESSDVYRVGKEIQWTWPKAVAAVAAVVVALVLGGSAVGIVAGKSAGNAVTTASDSDVIVKALDDGFKRVEGVTVSSSKAVADEVKALSEKFDEQPKPPSPVIPPDPKPSALSVPERVEVVVKGGLVKVKASAPSEVQWAWRPSPSFKVDRYGDVIYVEALAEGSLVAVAYTVASGKVADVAACVVATSELAPKPNPEPLPDPKPPTPRPVSLDELGKLVLTHACKPNRKDDAAKLAEVYEKVVAKMSQGVVRSVPEAVKELFDGNTSAIGRDNLKHWAGFFAWADNELTRRAELGKLNTLEQNRAAFAQIGAALREASK